jgi:NTP pyrophosphatase (non-canonical NTP hydrolase)
MDTRPDETLRAAGLEDVARYLVAEKGITSALTRTVDACATYGPDARIDRICASEQLLPAVVGVDVVDMKGLSDHHTVLLRLDTARGMTPEQQWTLQVLKLSEEVGETAQAVVGAWGTNPRKGQSHTWRHVQEEMADTAITSLVALYRMLGDEAPTFFAAVLAHKSAKFLPQDSAADALAVEEV